MARTYMKNAAFLDFGEEQIARLKELRNEKRLIATMLDDTFASEFDCRIGGLFNKISKAERNEIMAICQPYDPAELADAHKNYLLGTLVSLAIDCKPTASQQRYLNAMFAYLDCNRLRFDIDPLSIEDFEDYDVQKALYQVMIEYLSLADTDCYDKTALQEEFLDAFALTKKGRRAIESKLELLYGMAGEDGLLRRYEGLDKTEADTLEADDGNTRAPSSESLATPTEESLTEEVLIDDEVQVLFRMKQTYRDQIVRINATIATKGELRFDHCVVIFDQYRGVIEVDTEGLLQFSNCTIIEKYEYEPESSRIYHRSEHSKVEFDHCLIENARRFLASFKAIMLNCHIHNAGKRFVNLTGEKNCIIQNCCFTFDDDYEPDGHVMENVGDSKNGKLVFEHCSVEGFHSNAYNLINLSSPSDDAQEIYACSFVRCFNPIHATVSMKECRFDSSRLQEGIASQSFIQSCQFINMQGCVLKLYEVSILHCEFINWVGDDMKYNEPSDSAADCMIDIHRGVIDNCVFNGMRCNQDYVIKNSSYTNSIFFMPWKMSSSRDEDMINIIGCTWMHCTSKRVNPQLTSGIKCVDCTGLDRINKDGDVCTDYTVKTTAADGSAIGASL